MRYTNRDLDPGGFLDLPSQLVGVSESWVVDVVCAGRVEFTGDVQQGFVDGDCLEEIRVAEQNVVKLARDGAIEVKLEWHCL